MRFVYLSSFFLFLVLPVSAGLAAAPDLSYVKNIGTESSGVVGLLIPMALGAALLFFLWGMSLFILHADDESERAKGRKVMMWGIIGLFVIVSIWGIIGWISFTVGPQNTIGEEYEAAKILN